MLVKNHVICANTIQVQNSWNTKVKKKVSPVSLKTMFGKLGAVLHPDSVITKQLKCRGVQV